MHITKIQSHQVLRSLNLGAQTTWFWVANAKQNDVVEHGPAKGGEVVAPHGVKGTEEGDPGAVRLGHELQHGPLEPAFAFGLVRHLQGRSPGEGLHDHRALTGVAGVPDGEQQPVGLADDRPHHLRDRALFSGHQLDGPFALRHREMVGVDVLHRL